MEETRKIYIGNLDYSVTEDDIKRVLKEKGISVNEVNIITDKYTSRSKGFGFAEVETEEEVQKAIDAINGQELNGRTLNVSRARKMKPRRDSFGGGGGGQRRDRFGGGGDSGGYRRGGRY